MAETKSVFHWIRPYWWFPLPWILLQLVPSYASRGYKPFELPALNQYVITHPIKSEITNYLPFFQLVPLVLLVGLFVFNGKAVRLFTGYATIIYALAGVLQSVSISERWGLAICTGNLLTFSALAVLWLLETIRPQSGLIIRQKGFRHYWPLALAFFAFWGPVNPQTLLPDFNLKYLITSGTGLSFCLTTPLYLVVLNLAYPGVNRILMASLAFVGFYMGIFNLILEFLIIPSYWWIGVLHFPLLILSAWSLYRVVRDTDQPDGLLSADETT